MKGYHLELEKAERLHHKLDQFLPLTEEQQEIYWKKISLEWNYNSNHIEGNTISYLEAKRFLFQSLKNGNHTSREYEEMHAHNVAIDLIKSWASDQERELTESDIRDLNKLILAKEFFKDAQTIDGQKTSILITPGRYKSQPSHVRLPSGNIHKYAEPEYRYSVRIF